MRLFLVLSILVIGMIAGTRAEAEEAKVSKPNVLWHFVAFRFKDDEASQHRIPAMIKKYEELKDLAVDPKNPSRHLIKGFIYGKNTNPEQLSFLTKGEPHGRETEYGFILTFDNEADRDQYVDRDPYHQQFKKDVLGLLEGGANGVFVVDFTAPAPASLED